MSDTAELRLFAEVCRALAEGTRDPGDKESWSRLALKWERMESADTGTPASFRSGLPTEPAHGVPLQSA
jgi:hypothetical protein